MVSIKNLVAACKGDMRHLIFLDDTLENLYRIEKVEIYQTIMDDFIDAIMEIYGEDFLQKFFDVCNSNDYVGYLEGLL